eukprot:1612858-Ditylum_brightwellii.AAC.1
MSIKTYSCQEACQQTGSNQPDLNGVADIIELLRNRPSLMLSHLRPFVEKYVLSYKSTDTQFMSNFKRTHDGLHSPGYRK